MSDSDSKGHKSKDSRKESGDLPIGTKLFAVAAIAFLSSMGYLIMNDELKCLSAGTTPKDIPTFESRLKFVFQYQPINILWLMFCVFYTGSKRSGTGAVNPLAGFEHHVLAAQKIHQNSIEQYIMSLVSQLILVSFLDAATIIKVIPALNLLFIIGRVSFWLGYPIYRSFGYLTTMVPTLATIMYNLYRFYNMMMIINVNPNVNPNVKA